MAKVFVLIKIVATILSVTVSKLHSVASSFCCGSILYVSAVSFSLDDRQNKFASLFIVFLILFIIAYAFLSFMLLFRKKPSKANHIILIVFNGLDILAMVLSMGESFYAYKLLNILYSMVMIAVFCVRIKLMNNVEQQTQ